MSRARRSFLLAAAGLLLAAASQAQPAWQGPASVGIEVRDKSGAPVVGATVTLHRGSELSGPGPAPLRTDREGRAAFSGLAEGDWVLEITHADYMAFRSYLEARTGKEAKTSFAAQVATSQSFAPMRVATYKARGPAGTPVPAAAADVTPSAARATPPAVPAPAAAPAAHPTPEAGPAPSVPPPSPPAAPTPAPPAPKPAAATSPAPATAPLAPASALPPAPAPEGAPAAQTAPRVAAPSSSAPVPAPAAPAATAPAAAAPATPSPPAPTTPAPSPSPAPGHAPTMPAPVAPVAAAPSAAAPAPAPAPSSGSTAPPAAAPAPLASAVASPAAALRSAARGTCPECKAGESALTVDGIAAAAATPGACTSELQRAAASAMAQSARSLAPGVAAGASIPLDASVATLAADGASGCRLLALTLPAGAKYLGYRYDASDSGNSADCLQGQECPIGRCGFAEHAAVERGPNGSVVWVLFENRDATRARRAELVVYYRAGGAAP